MKAIALIDLQNDFIDGSLAVGSERFYKAWDNTMKLVARENFDVVLATMDYHPKNHCSFKAQGGVWPDHCVRGSEGGRLNWKVMEFLDGVAKTKLERGEDYPLTLLKGKDAVEEEYGVNLLDTERYTFDEAKDTVRKITEIHIAGLCTDFCVKNCAIETAKSNKEIPVYVHNICSVAINPDEKIDFSDYPNIHFVD